MRFSDVGRRWTWVGLGFVLAVIGLACGDDDGPKPPADKQVSDFTLLDINTKSPTHGQYVSLSDFDGQIVMIFNGAATCSICRGEVEAMSMAIDSLSQDGLTGIAGMMIISIPNQNPADPDYLSSMDSTLPVMRDSVDAVHGGSAVLRLIDCENFNDFIFIDRAGYMWKKTKVGELPSASYDFRPDVSPSGYAQLLAWLREIDAL
jgi:hypothetical protein